MIRRLPAVAAIAVLLTAAGCAPADPSSAASSAPTAASANPSAPQSDNQSDNASPSPTVSQIPTPSTASPSSSTAADVTVAVTIDGGKVTPNAVNIRVELGQTVLVTAVSDVEDSIHVHGYDKTLTVGPGESAQVVFTADEPGVFEVETHESAKLAAKLIVS